MAAEATARATVRAVQAARSVTTADGLYLPAMADVNALRLILAAGIPAGAPPAFPWVPLLCPPHVQGTALCVDPARDLVLSAGPLALLAVGLLVYWPIGGSGTPPRPKRSRWATGPAKRLQKEFGKRYQNRWRPRASKCGCCPATASWPTCNCSDGALAQTWPCPRRHAELQPDDPENLVSLGSRVCGAGWVFYRTEAPACTSAPADGLRQLRGMRVNDHGLDEGSGKPRPGSWNQLLAGQPADGGWVTMTRLEETPATVAFLAGKHETHWLCLAPESLGWCRCSG